MNGNKLKAVRKINGLNQADFAKALGITQSYYSTIELDKKPITKEILATFISKFAVSKEWFLNDKGPIFLSIEEKEQEEAKLNGVAWINTDPIFKNSRVRQNVDVARLEAENLRLTESLKHKDELLEEKERFINLLQDTIANYKILLKVDSDVPV